MKQSWLAMPLLVLYVGCALVQWNDPDPVRWMLLYGSAALLCALALRGGAPRAALIGLAVIALVWAAAWAPSALSNAFRFDEEQRELAGLLIVAGGMLRLLPPRHAGEAPAAKEMR